MSAQIQFRRGTAREWITSNPILAPGELGLETDTGKFKIGNGNSPWASLNYSGLPGPSGPSGVQGPVNRYVETLLNFDTSTYYLTMSAGVGNVAIKNNTALTYVANSGILTVPLVQVSSTQNSISTTTGALTVAGGVGIGGKTFLGDDATVGGQLYLNWNNGEPGPAILPGTSNNLLPGIFDIGSPSGTFRSLYLSNDIHNDGKIYSDDDVQVNGQLYINWNDGEVGPGILPGVSGALLSDVYDIGSPDGRFKNLYLSGNIDNLGDTRLGGDIEIDGHLYINLNNGQAGSAILPGTATTSHPNVFDIGSSTAPFRNIYSDAFYGTTIRLSGHQLVQGTLTAGNTSVVGDLRIAGNLYVNGTQTIVNSTSIQTGDKTIALSTGSPIVALAANSGIIIGPVGSPYGTFLFDGNNNFVSSLGLNVVGEVTAYYSDRRLKTNVSSIPDALEKVNKLNGIIYTANELANNLGFHTNKSMVGVFADEVDAVLPQAVCPAPFDQSPEGSSISGENYQTVKYEKLVPLLIEAIKELTTELASVKSILKSAGLN